MTPRLLLAVASTSAAVISACAPAALAAPPALTEKAVQDASFSPLPDRSSARAEPEVVKAEVLLDRAHFSPGVIDGIDGDNFRKAVTAYQKQMGLPASGRLDQATWDRLTAGAPAPLTRAEVTAADAKGPFTRRIPLDFEAQSRLKHMGFLDIREALAERFHMSQPLIMALNPGRTFAAGQQIVVANVERGKPTDRAARVVVDKIGHDVEALAADGRLLAYYPASIGSTDKPAPTGDFAIRRIAHNPDYTYFPRFHFKGVGSKEAFTIAPGPNNPVGLVWMDLSYDGYGIHGTPSPEAVGKTQSHGCIRLTNWDALNLAALVDKDTPVSFGDVPGSTGPVPPAPAPATPIGGQPSADAAAETLNPPDSPRPARRIGNVRP